MKTYRVGYFVGSLSSTSINRVLASALILLATIPLVWRRRHPIPVLGVVIVAEGGGTGP